MKSIVEKICFVIIAVCTIFLFDNTKVYAAGGETTTVIKTTKPTYNDTPYDAARKLLDGEYLAGTGVDARA